jgi:hypothetical protein
MKSWRTVSYTGSVIRYKRVIRAQVTKLLHTLFQSPTRHNVPGTRTVL